MWRWLGRNPWIWLVLLFVLFLGANAVVTKIALDDPPVEWVR